MIETIGFILTGLGLTASIIYYANILNNANKTQQLQLETRQVQLFMNIFQNINSEESMTTWVELMRAEFTDYDDWAKKYDSQVNPQSWGKRTHIWYNYHGLGVLLRDGIIKIELIDDLVGMLALHQWNKYGNIIKEMQVRQGLPRAYYGFEYLVEELEKYYQEHPELRSIITSEYEQYVAEFKDNR